MTHLHPEGVDRLGAVLQRRQPLVGELLTAQVDHLAAGEALAVGEGQALQQVGLAQTGTAVDEHRVDAAAGLVDQVADGLVGQTVGRADHEVLEQFEAGAELTGHPTGARFADWCSLSR